jgi:hypothetical protein
MMPYVLFFLITITMGTIFKQKRDKEALAIKFDEDLARRVSNSGESDSQLVQEDLSQSVRDFDALQTAEQVHRLQCEERLIDAKYKMSYIIWKCKVLWPVFDFISRYFVVVIYITIFCFALYYQIAVLWLVMITLSMLQFVSVSNNQFALQKRLKDEYFGNESTREMAMTTDS